MAASHKPLSARFLRWRLAIPPEKGGWVWWIGPLVVGAVAAPGGGLALVVVCIAAWVAFCLRQPVTLATKQLRKRHGKRDLAPPLFWTVIYTVVLAGLAWSLWRLGHGRVIALGLLALPVFAWHLALVYQGRDRHQMLLDISAALALGLAGPAAYWAAGGDNPAVAFWVWALPALQSTASVVHMFLRLSQRALHAIPSLQVRLAAGVVPMAVHMAALGAAAGAYYIGHVSFLAVIALAIPALEGGWSVVQPQVGHAPKRLGMRQLAVSSVSMVLLAAGMALGVGR